MNLQRTLMISFAMLTIGFLSGNLRAQDADEYRTWTDVTGKFKIEAMFVEFSDGQVVLKRKDTGKTLSVPIKRMSPSDLTIARKWARENNSVDQTPSSQPVASQTESAVPAASKKAWKGNWNNRKYGTKGPVTCIAVVQDNQTWKASFVGTGLGKPFKYEATIKATSKGDQMQLKGESKVDGDSYTWNGYVRGKTL